MIGAFRITRIERYVLFQTLKSLGMSLAVIASLVLLIDFVEVSRSVSGHADLGAMRLVGLTAMKSPAVILQLLPFVFLFGTLASFVGLNRRSELVAMRAAGVSAWRFVFPAAGAALLIGVISVTLLHPIAASLDGAYERERARIRGGTPDAEQSVVWLREGDDNRQIVIRAEGRDRATGRLNDVSFFIYTVGEDGSRRFSERIDADMATLSSGSWRLDDARGASVGQRARAYASLDLPSSIADDDAFNQFADPDSTPFWSLPAQVSRIESAGFSATAHRLKFQQLLATPLMFAAMSILAAAFSLRLMRLGDLARMSVAAVVLGFAFFFINQFTAALGAAEAIPAFFAAWLPPILTALSAFTLLFYTEDG
ncbi:MAG: lipopolysaccharide export system permease protein [Brevundimonas sp.]|jgi:lipopolysaccharide export system permease protein|uniref:LPS export ABC transporter permease LptG n=1 Tax=Brevundimonas sp. TaxID=1871086 RepID=UPI0039E626BE